LFTSIIPNLLVDGIVEAILQSRAMKFYVCNVMTQAGETDNYSAEDHLRVLLEHGRKGIADYIVVNSRSTISEDVLARYADEGAAPVYYNKAELEALKVKVIEANLLNEQQVLRHDSARLAACIMDVIYTRCGLKFPLGWRKIYKIARKKAK
ncbi:MAG: YvcK family protein, partial [Peptococcaceae bacterium]|nr:YvcK family protein [Peptococcaceae bacterium]